VATGFEVDINSQATSVVNMTPEESACPCQAFIFATYRRQPNIYIASS
jgi:metal-sulfur cluster biosynthetic enzyme